MHPFFHIIGVILILVPGTVSRSSAPDISSYQATLDAEKERKAEEEKKAKKERESSERYKNRQEVEKLIIPDNLELNDSVYLAKLLGSIYSLIQLIEASLQTKDFVIKIEEKELRDIKRRLEAQKQLLETARPNIAFNAKALSKTIQVFEKVHEAAKKKGINAPEASFQSKNIIYTSLDKRASEWKWHFGSSDHAGGDVARSLLLIKSYNSLIHLTQKQGQTVEELVPLLRSEKSKIQTLHKSILMLTKKMKRAKKVHGEMKLLLKHLGENV